MKKLTIVFSFLALLLVLGQSSAKADIDNNKIYEIYMATRASDFYHADKWTLELIAESPRESEYHWIAANVYLKQGEIEKAQTELDTAQKLAPGLPYVVNKHFLNVMQNTLYTAEAARAKTAHIWFMVFIAAVVLLFVGFIMFLLIQRKRTKAEIRNRFYPTPTAKSFGAVPPHQSNSNYANGTQVYDASYPEPRPYTPNGYDQYDHKTVVVNNGVDPMTAVLMADAMSQNNQPTVIEEPAQQQVVQEDVPATVDSTDFGVDTSQDNSGDASSSDFGTDSSNN